MERSVSFFHANSELLSSSRGVNAEFVSTSPRSLCVSLCSNNGDDAAVVRTTAFTATVSPELAPRRAEKEALRPAPIGTRPEERRPPAPFVPLGLAGLTLPQIERAAILETLLVCGGRRRQAARKLGISEKTIYNKIKIYRLQAELDAALRD